MGQARGRVGSRTALEQALRQPTIQTDTPLGRDDAAGARGANKRPGSYTDREGLRDTTKDHRGLNPIGHLRLAIRSAARQNGYRSTLPPPDPLHIRG